MDTLQILFFLIIGATTLAGVYILVAKPTIGNWAFASTMCAVFLVYTLVQIAQEGLVMFYTNHSANLTGLQVWWDLVMCVLIALFFILPRARKVGMNVIPWALLVATTASIGLLAMCARLFWLERQASAASNPVSATA
ncbi:MAG: hypothetical protein QNI87_06260 [Erythrobacter sp.]|uniref:hypothetical protein n=1 Tax=Erythrobacter sp. TaxID=1042 RepID=UPI0026236E47|nr:hypothetical protein [Erythrobacter sp.]MDJ0978119.1 hypothetical protein [Erythrobacter sp.]